MTRAEDGSNLNAGEIRHLAPGSPVVRALVRLIRPRVAKGAIAVALPNGKGFVVNGSEPGPVARVEIVRWRALLRVALGGTGGLADSYAAGDWDSPAPAVLVEFGACNLDRSADDSFVGVLSRPWRRTLHHLRRNTRKGSRRNIAAHYDIGNDFYEAWLDRTMTYSGALFAREGLRLEDAQTAKYRRLLRGLDSRPGQHILEVGCGWGGLAEVAARDFGLRVTAVTVSRAQFDYVVARIRRAGLADHVCVRLQDYRDIEGQFDHVVSVEMLEAVGQRYWSRYFQMLADRLVEGGRAAIQVITIDDSLFEAYCRRADFIQTRIFPGGMLPSPEVIHQEAGRAGLLCKADFAFGNHYARTLSEWRRRFDAAQHSIEVQGFDPRFRRLWAFYLSYCEGGFRAGRIDVHQYLFEHAEARS